MAHHPHQVSAKAVVSRVGWLKRLPLVALAGLTLQLVSFPPPAVEGRTAGTPTATSMVTDAWRQLTPAGPVPPERESHTAVWEPGSGEILVFGGVASSGNFLNDLWAYRAALNGWTQLTPAGTPPAIRHRPSAVWDPGNAQLLVFGGATPRMSANDLWSYRPSANTWTQLSPTGTLPPGRWAHTAVWDPGNAQMLVFGGWTGQMVLTDLWSFRPASNAWTELAPAAPLPPARGWQGAAWDTANARMLVFGGSNNLTLFNDLWAYRPESNTWSELTPPGTLPVISDWPTAVWDPGNGQMLVFGGWTLSPPPNGTVLDHLWAYRPAANAWTQLPSTGLMPPARWAHAAVWDSGNAQMYVFGGCASFYPCTSNLNDLWVSRPGLASASPTPTPPALATTTPTATPTSTGTPMPAATATGTPRAGPSVSAISPTSGSIWGGTQVILSGMNFAGGARVSFNGAAATDVTVVSATSITARTPPNPRQLQRDVNGDGRVTAVDALCILRLVAALPATTACPAAFLTAAVDILVTNPDGQTGTLAGAYTYHNADVNGDGRITSVDALCALRSVAGLPATTACPGPASAPTPTPTATSTTGTSGSPQLPPMGAPRGGN